MIQAAQEQGQLSAAAIAAALDAAGLLQSPETAGELVELDRLQARVAELETELAEYVGLEPTVAEELAFLRGCVGAVHDVCDAAERRGIVSGGPFTVEAVRIAADGGRAYAGTTPPPRRSGVLPARDALCSCGHTGVDHHHGDTKCWAHLPKTFGDPILICPCASFSVTSPEGGDR
ncbi:hypothetical protein [Streptomyces sp. NPDC001889]